MAKVNCPHCGERALRVPLIQGYKYYCGRCGWNVEIGRSELRSESTISLVIVVAGMLLAGYVALRDTSFGILLTAFYALPLYFFTRSRLYLRKLDRLETDGSYAVFVKAASAGSSLPPDNSARTVYFKDRSFPELEANPRPRAVRLTWRGRLYLVLIVAVVGTFSYFPFPALLGMLADARETAAKSWLALLLPEVLINSWAVVFLRNRMRERELISNGELTTGFIMLQENNRYTQNIAYGYKDMAGSSLTGRCSDASHSLYEGMTGAVFYDPRKPERSVLLEAGLTRLAGVK